MRTRQTALEDAVKEFISLPYKEARKNLAGWRATFELLLDSAAYNSIESMRTGKQHFTPLRDILAKLEGEK